MERLLTTGSRGRDVKEVQALLNGQLPGVHPPLIVDGTFGIKTKARVEEYQGAYKLHVDGIVGPKTLGRLRGNLRIVIASKAPRFLASGASLGRFGLFAAPRIGQASLFSIPVPLGAVSQNTDLGVLQISELPEMPKIDLDVKIEGMSPDPTPSTLFTWVVSITFVAADACTCGKPGVQFDDGFTVPSILGGRFSPIFPWIRGGSLTVGTRARVYDTWVESIFYARVIGTEPAWSKISPVLETDIMRRLARHESGGGHQFEVDPNTSANGIVPVFNRGRDGGVGLLQVTPVDSVQKANDPGYKDAVWNWRSNIQQGKQIFSGHRSAAQTYLNAHKVNGRYPNNGDPQGPVRIGSGVGDETVLLWETIQRFNGGTHWQWNTTINAWESRPQKNQTYVASVLAQTP